MPAIIERECIGGGVKLDYDDCLAAPVAWSGLELEDQEIRVLLQMLHFMLSEKTNKEVRDYARYFGIPEHAEDTLLERIEIALCQ
jgi:hypothetical protein